MPELISPCCGAEVYVAGKLTKWYQCSKCKQACDTIEFHATDEPSEF